MGSPIMPGGLPERFLVLVPLALILPQGFDAVPTPIRVKPHLRQHQAHRLDARLHPDVRHDGEFADIQMRRQLLHDALARL